MKHRASARPGPAGYVRVAGDSSRIAGELPGLDIIVRGRSTMIWVVLAVTLLQAGAATPKSPVPVPHFRGVVVDAAGAEIPGALVRFLDERSRKTVAETHTDREGKFELALHGSGDYVLFVSRVGFADQWISISDPKQESVDRTVQLQAEDCDAPDVICDIFSSTPLAREQHPVISRARLLVAPGKAINLLAGAVTTMRSTTAEIGLSRSATGLFLIPLNQASLLSSCRNADGPRLFSIRIDGFGPRSEICVRSRDGQLAKIFITREITSLDQQVPVYVVTRTN